MNANNLIVSLVCIVVLVAVLATVIAIAYFAYRKKAREQKNYERALKMVQIMIHLPPSSEDKDATNRDIRDVTDEAVSQAQTMYNVIASTATKGFHSRLYGQRHMAFEIVASEGLVHYYAVVPYVLLNNVKQAIMAAYPTARLEEVEEINLFSRAGKISGTLGGELTLTKPYVFPIATYKDTKRDAMGAILNALTMARRGDGVGIQILLRPAREGWSRKIDDQVQDIRDGKKGASTGRKGLDLGYFAQILEALWRPPTATDKEKEVKPLSGTDQSRVEAMEEKARHAGYEVMIRLIASTPNSARSQALLTGVQSAFSLFNSPTGNGFKFTPASNIEDFVTSYIMRFFPAERSTDILNTVELASIFHLPNQTNIPSAQVERQTFKEVDGPTQVMNEGLLLGYNVFRGTKKPIRLSTNDRRRHVYVMGSTGMGKSVFLENLALQDMVAGRGFAFVDPHGDSAEKLLQMVPRERVDDVIYFNPADMEHPIGMNLFEVDPNDPDPDRTKDYIVSETINMFYSLYDPNRQGIVGPRMANIVRYAALLTMADPAGGTFMDIPKLLNDPDFAKPKIKYLTNQRAIDFWTKEWPNSQRSNDAGEVTSWVVSKWADFENTMMNNILGQVHSSLNLRDIMDNNKILLVNLSKGKLGEMPAKLLGMIFVMKFQAAAMSRANIPEDQRTDFCLYVDEFQNFATDSFESILSEARKYRLNLIVANQFMGQLIDKIRGAVHGNVGTYVIGRVGTDDVEDVVKMFQPVFSSEDLLFMPNYTAAVKMLINGAPTSPFSMQLPAPMGHPNPELGASLAKVSAAKYGRPRAEVEAEIKRRWSTVKPTPTRKPANSVVTPKPATPSSSTGNKAGGSGSSFLDNWLAKRQALANNSGATSGSDAKSNQTIQPTAKPTQPLPQFTPQAIRPTQPVIQQTPTTLNTNRAQQPIVSSPTTPNQPSSNPQLAVQQSTTMGQMQYQQSMMQQQPRPVNNGTEWARPRTPVTQPPQTPNYNTGNQVYQQYQQPYAYQGQNSQSAPPANQGQVANDNPNEFTIKLH